MGREGPSGSRDDARRAEALPVSRSTRLDAGGACPDENVLVRFARGESDDGEVALVEEHLDGCDGCRRAVAAAATDETLPASSGTRVLEAGTRLGRYEVEKLIGVGGMGVVYAGHDVTLARRVALKRLHGDDPAAQHRLLREAQSMARLSHPNVVNVFELGEATEGRFLAMELVDGVTLGEWLKRGQPASAVLDRFVEAGRGLAAAHAAGVVHRDFKPANVLVGADGRARVTDFGLSRPLEGAPQSGASALVTQLGALVGTLAYMAPEQLRGEAADARSDQFSFCLALAEALGGSRPFDGATREARLAALGRPPAFGAGVPRRIRPVLARGLALDPSSRFPDLGALLQRLARARSPRGPRVAAVASTVAGVAIAAAAALLMRTPAPRVDFAARVITLGQGQSVKLPTGPATKVTTSDAEIAGIGPATNGVMVHGAAAGAACVTLHETTGEQRFTALVGGASGDPCAHAPREDEVATFAALPAPAASSIVVGAGEKTLVWIPGLERVAVGDPAVADVHPAGNSVLEVLGVAAGKTSIIVWSGNESRRWEVEVAPR